MLKEYKEKGFFGFSYFTESFFYRRYGFFIHGFYIESLDVNEVTKGYFNFNIQYSHWIENGKTLKYFL